MYQQGGIYVVQTKDERYAMTNIENPRSSRNVEH